MSQKYRIYINEKVVLITARAPKQANKFQRIDSEHFDLEIIYPWVQTHPGRYFYVRVNDPKAFLKKAIKTAKLIEAAGGLVRNEDGTHLFIYRNGKWDLPKGKLEKGEKKKVAAVREVEEECGIKVNKLESKICRTYHMYTWKNKTVLKKTYWYLMSHKGKARLVPQKEEGITDVRWFDRPQISAIVKNTFPSIMDVLEKAELLTDRVKLP